MKKEAVRLGLVTVTGTAVVLLAAKPLKKKLVAEKNRHEVKQFVRHHVKNSRYLMNTINRLSDQSINQIAKLIQSAMKAKKQLKIQGETMNGLVHQVLQEIDAHSYVNVREPQS